MGSVTTAKRLWATVAAGLTAASLAGAQPPAAETSGRPGATQAFTGTYSTDVVDAPTVAPGAFGPSSTILQNYVGLDLLYYSQIAPENTPRLIDLKSSAAAVPLIPIDGYTAGKVNTNMSPGFRWNLGRWTSDRFALEVGGTYIHPFFFKRSFDSITNTSGGLTGSNVVSNTATFVPTGAQLQHAEVFYRTGQYSFEVNGRSRAWSGESVNVDLLAGVRYYQVFERFNMDWTKTGGQPFNESFDTGNDMYLAQIGVETDVLLWQYVSLRSFAKFAGGVGDQYVGIRGPADGTGLLVGASNVGSHQRTHFTNVIDFGVSLVGHLTPNIEASVGFTGVWLGDVLRASNLLDVQGAGTDPTFHFSNDSLFLYGISAGVKIDF